MAAAYAGGLVIPEGVPGERPYVIANFVASLDGVTSYTEPGYIGGGAISGFNEPDHFVMGLLRARGDAVIFRSRTLHQDPGHLRLAPFVYPALTHAHPALPPPLRPQDTLPPNQ